MKVEKRFASNAVKFESLSCGDLFSFLPDEEDIYMKVSGDYIVCLQDGRCTSFDRPDCIVASYPDTTIVIEQNR